jgi:acid phosphatase (class A)
VPGYAAPMNQSKRAAFVTVLICGAYAAAACGQGTAILASGVKPSAMKVPKAAKAGYYIDPSVLTLLPLLPGPPAPDSLQLKQELTQLHRIERERTAVAIAAAQADDAEEDIFSYRTVLGAAFTPDTLPLTTALSAHVHNEEGVASAFLKEAFARPRPYQADKTLHPVCKLTDAPNSYPSGHSLSGYLLAYTLAEMLPEKKQLILDRADAYAHNRLVCGVHYASDLEASRRTALVVFGNMMAQPKFQHDLKAARTEVREHLGFAPATN